jgi:5-methyltetrahydrofolate--homocysteine methyltransferase
MVIIGEKINGAIKSVAKAIAEGDAEFIKGLAVRQAEGGADYIDVCASTDPAIEREKLKWLMGLVQDSVDVPLSVDSSDVRVIADVLGHAKKEGIINSVSEEAGKTDFLFPIIAKTGWKVVCLTCDQAGIPTDADTKVRIAEAIIEKADKHGIAHDRLYIDPLVNSIATVGTALVNFNEAVRRIKAAHPDVHVTSGLSNISFGMPLRKAINQAFLVLAMGAGMDSAILDPTSIEMRTARYSAEMLLGLDEYCAEFLGAFREGLIGLPAPAAAAPKPA